MKMVAQLLNLGSDSTLDLGAGKDMGLTTVI